jgi:hypothetical protein
MHKWMAGLLDKCIRPSVGLRAYVDEFRLEPYTKPLIEHLNNLIGYLR